MLVTHWACAHCPTTGTTDRAAEKHTRAEGHSTLTSVRADALARMAARVRSGT